MLACHSLKFDLSIQSSGKKLQPFMDSIGDKSSYIFMYQFLNYNKPNSSIPYTMFDQKGGQENKSHKILLSCLLYTNPSPF